MVLARRCVSEHTKQKHTKKKKMEVVAKDAVTENLLLSWCEVKLRLNERQSENGRHSIDKWDDDLDVGAKPCG